MLSKRRPNQLISVTDQTLFVHVAVILAFIFLVIFLTLPTPFHRGMVPDLPRVNHPVSMPHANREDAMVVAILRDDKVFFRKDRVTPDQLPAKIRESVNQGAEKKVYIKADARAKYGWVAEALDGVRDAGIEKIGILVDQRRAPTSNP